MVCAMFRLLGIVLAQILLCSHRLHRTLFQGKYRRNVNVRCWDKAALLGLMWLKQEKLRWLDGRKAAGYTRSTGQQTRTLRHCVRERVIGVEGVFLSMRYDNIRCRLAYEFGHLC